jgi:hypothetical protein
MVCEINTSFEVRRGSSAAATLAHNQDYYVTMQHIGVAAETWNLKFLNVTYMSFYFEGIEY